MKMKLLQGIALAHHREAGPFAQVHLHRMSVIDDAKSHRFVVEAYRLEIDRTPSRMSIGAWRLPDAQAAA